MPNTNCLEGMRCPKCGYEDKFFIVAEVELAVTDDGTEDEGGDKIWGDNSPCRCDECQHEDIVDEFRIETQERKADEKAKEPA